jgi:hypothetical protein
MCNVRLIETFTGEMLRAEPVQQPINHPANAINIQSDTHDSMDQKLAWGINASDARLVIRVYGLDRGITQQIAEIFGRGIGGDTVQLPGPPIYNLQRAVVRVFADSGIVEVFDKYLGGNEDDMTQKFPFISADRLLVIMRFRVCAWLEVLVT